MARYIRLTGRQQLALRDALYAAYDTPEAFAELLLFFDLRLASQGAFNDPYPRKILASIQTLEDSGQLAAFIQKVRQSNLADPEFERIENELKLIVTSASPNNPFEVCLLTGGHILVNRSKLRLALKELSTNNGRRILLVRDDPALAVQREHRVKTGKSHTLQVISYLDQVADGFSFFRIDLEELNRTVRSGETIQPLDIAKRIAEFMDCKQECQKILDDPPKDGQWSRWTYDFCNAFEKETKKREEKTWIVIDSFHVTLLPQDTMDLLKQLASRVNVSLPRLRLILIGFPGVLHPSIPVAQEILDRFGEDALVEFFARALPEKNIPLDEDKVADTVAAVLEGLDPKQPDYIEQVCARAIAELERL